jgi:hypothetical protein
MTIGRRIHPTPLRSESEGATSVARRMSGRSPTAMFPRPRDVGDSVSVPVPVGDSGSMSRYQIVLLRIGPTGSGYRPSTGQTIVRKSPLWCDGASPDSGSESLGPLQRREGGPPDHRQTGAFSLPAATDDLGSTVEKGQAPGAEAMGRADGLPVARGKHLPGRPLCSPSRDSNDEGELRLMARPGDRSDRRSPSPLHSTEAVDCDDSVVWVRSSSCGSEY